MVSFIFPAGYFNNKKADDFYEQERLAFKETGFPVYTINIDDLENAKPYPSSIDAPIIYRGWMLSKDQYQQLNNKLNGQLIVDADAYLKSHHLPNWYESIKDFTIESVVTTEENAKETFKNLNWGQAFLKDYVKSIKTGKGSIVDSTEDIDRAFSDMLKYKGFIEGGIVFRKALELFPETEHRFFVLNGNIFSDNTANNEMYNLVEKVSQQHNAFFYSVDIIYDKNNKLHVIEIGDGQVSDSVGWDINSFVQIFESLKHTKKLKP